MKQFAAVFIIIALTGCERQPKVEQASEMNSHLESIMGIVAEQLGISADAIHGNSTFASIGADDLDLVEIIMAAEDAYNVSIPDETLMKIANTSESDELVRSLEAIS